MATFRPHGRGLRGDSERELGEERKGAWRTLDPKIKWGVFQSRKKKKMSGREKGERRLGFYQMAPTLQWKSVQWLVAAADLMGLAEEAGCCGNSVTAIFILTDYCHTVDSVLVTQRSSLMTSSFFTVRPNDSIEKICRWLVAEDRYKSTLRVWIMNPTACWGTEYVRISRLSWQTSHSAGRVKEKGSLRI